ncbi:hypothetical protein T484DRAFT_1861179 [Baffinella frigidus]|nr:hypothetical protein T484DRAFT_1861179 [Cryptophyta sp. CCMP2293]
MVARAQGGGDVRENKMIESNVDPNAWKVEVENVAPMLKIRAESDNKQWLLLLVCAYYH